ncbi:hypothetical protein OHC33_000986 [Knufia fluminis]|uniref:Cytochrome P450 n=1 Tax=Knufia fluminis TaxID=191047 RepID=A0AAN8I770_9EURO|nr:hypothetical protein OHC33_000986 [Knufia fluminis]
MSSAQLTMLTVPVEVMTLHSLQLATVAVVVLSFAAKLFSRSRKVGKPLPTPGGSPWAGPVWAVEAANIYKTFKTWSEKFGSLYEVKLFGQNLIIISDPQIAKEILAQKAKIVSDRPTLALIKGSKDSGKYLPILGHNDQHNNYHGRMLPEATRFVHQLLEKHDDPFMLVDQLCGRLSSRMAFGTPAPRAAISRSAHNFMQNLSPGGQTTNVLTFLRHLPTFLNSDKHNEAMRVDIEDRVWYGCYDKAKAAYENGTLKPSYAKYYFDQREKTGLTEHEALHSIGMMATVSILTLIAPLQRWLVVMAEHPEWQVAVQKELDEALQGRMADYFDSPKLPVLRATILESMRYASPVPTGIPHRLEADMEYNGYHLRKNSNVVACDWSMCRSNKYYKDAETFNPSRYLDPASPQYKEPLTEFPKIQGHTVFGWGRRVCAGMEYSATQLLVVCAAVSYSFNIDIATDPKTNQRYHLSLDDATPHAIPVLSQETGLKLLFSPQSESRAEELRDTYRLQREQDKEKEEEECY